MSDVGLNDILKVIRSDSENIFGTELVEVILYGSYARGDFDAESDIDLALITKCSRMELKKYQNAIVDLMSDLSLEYDILVNIACIPFKDFEGYKDVLPYYRNINSEGVRIIA